MAAGSRATSPPLPRRDLEARDDALDRLRKLVEV
jgi:hypothetical protein